MTRILVVEDEAAISDVLVEVLRDEGYEVRAAAHGRAALDVLPTWMPDLVLTDLMMPVMDGATLLQALHETYGAALPVIVMSAIWYDGRPLPSIARATLAKPFRIEQVLALVAAVLG